LGEGAIGHGRAVLGPVYFYGKCLNAPILEKFKKSNQKFDKFVMHYYLVEI